MSILTIWLPALRAQVPTSASDFKFAFRDSKSAAVVLVEARGFEPLTPALQTRCSAN